MTKDDILPKKSKAFAIEIILLYKYLKDEKKEYVISNQLLRSGTSIGANIRESLRGQSTADFYAKLFIALKEAEESEYWLELLNETEILEQEKFEKLYNECEEIIKLLMSIIKHRKK